jgi:hypothetical protein
MSLLIVFMSFVRPLACSLLVGAWTVPSQRVAAFLFHPFTWTSFEQLWHALLRKLVLPLVLQQGMVQETSGHAVALARPVL